MFLWPVGWHCLLAEAYISVDVVACLMRSGRDVGWFLVWFAECMEKPNVINRNYCDTLLVSFLNSPATLTLCQLLNVILHVLSVYREFSQC